MAQFLCPITKEIMNDPVIALDGHTYQRDAIQAWFDTGNNTSPMTREIIGSTLIINHTMRSELSNAGFPVKTLNVKLFDNKNEVKITLVLDLSGSMATSVESHISNEPSFSRLDLIKHSIVAIAEMMRPYDSLNIVTFSTSAYIKLPWTKMTEDGKNEVKQIAASLIANGGTDIPLGVETGILQGGDHLILLTDGANNAQVPLRQTLGEYILSKIEPFQGIIHCVGLGMANDLDTPTLRLISSKKKGFYCFCPDASMVGTVFIHLMANIIVNEQGNTFDEYDLFLKTLVDVYYTRGINSQNECALNILYQALNILTDPILKEDLVSLNENKGQVEKAIKYWDTWGKHYLPALIDAHLHKMTTNFKDASLQRYTTKNTRDFIDVGETIFLKIKAPLPSCNNLTNVSFNNYRLTSSILNSQGLCFGPNTLFKIISYTGNDKIETLVPIKDIKKGMFIKTKTTITTVRCVIISPEVEMIKINKDKEFFWISKKHPLYVNDKFYWAEQLDHNPIHNKIMPCYNLILDSDHFIEIGQTNIYTVTLGHNKKGPVVEHDYLGTSKIIDDLMKSPGWNDGQVILKGFKRDTIGIYSVY